MKITRKEFLTLIGASVASRPLAPPAEPAEPAEFAELAELNGLPQRAARIIQQYDQQGIHRTATGVDQKSANWLAAQVRQCGVKPTLEPFPVSRVDPRACYVEISGRRIEGLPVFDGGFTEATGLRGRISQIEMRGGEAEIGLVEAPPNAEYAPAYKQLRRESRQRAILLITKAARLGLCPINAADFTAPFGPPVLQVSSAEAEWLMQQADAKAQAILVAQIKRTSTRGFNVTAKIRGKDPKLAPIVIMTPRSGWWRAASERGGGLVCWLETLRVLAAGNPARDCWFIASSGHELGHLGLHNFTEHHQSLVKEAHVWIHFGANIGAAQGGGYRLQTSSAELEALAIEILKTAEAKVDEIAPRGNVPLGEAGNIYRGGGRYLSLLSPGNAFFHHPDDRWPQAVDVNAVTRYAGALAQVAWKLAQA